MKRYGVVVIGCGHIGQQHLKDIYYRDQVCLVGVVDNDLILAEECRRRYGAQSAGIDYRKYLKRSDVDIIIIATYTDTHLMILRQALEAGKHVLCEKPIGTNLQQCDEFLQIVRRSKCKVQIGHILRYNDTYRRAAELIAEGLIGPVKIIRIVHNHHSLDWPRYRRLLQDATPILDCGVHYFDVMQWFTQSKIVGVNALGTRIDEDLSAKTMNYGLAIVQLNCGAVGYYEQGWSQAITSANVTEIVGEKGSMEIIMNQFRSADIEEGDLIRVHLRENDEYRSINVKTKYRPMWRQLLHLIHMIEENVPPCPTHEEVYEAFCVAYTAQKCMSTDVFKSILFSDL